MATRFLGTTDDVTTCDCCGRKNLKATVALLLEDGDDDPVYFGVVCAARALKMPAKDVKRAARAADEAAAEIKAAAARAAAALEDAAWQAFLNERAPQFSRSFMGGPDRFRQLEALGGYAAARAAFLAGWSAA